MRFFVIFLNLQDAYTSRRRPERLPKGKKRLLIGKTLNRATAAPGSARDRVSRKRKNESHIIIIIFCEILLTNDNIRAILTMIRAEIRNRRRGAPKSRSDRGGETCEKAILGCLALGGLDDGICRMPAVSGALGFVLLFLGGPSGNCAGRSGTGLRHPRSEFRKMVRRFPGGSVRFRFLYGEAGGPVRFQIRYLL